MGVMKMASLEKRSKAQYYRTLELMAVISEEWGECILSLNNYNWKGQDIKELENAIEELQQMVSPMLELEAMLENMVKLKKMES
jgi:hypothetical protein